VDMVYGSAWKEGDIRKRRDVMKRAYQLGRTLGGGA